MGYVSRIFWVSLLVAVIAVVAVVLTKEEYKRPITTQIKKIQRSDGWRQIKKTWSSAAGKAKIFFNKVEDGKLSQEIADFIDGTCKALLGVGLADLPTHLKQLEGTWGGTTLLLVWLGIGLIVYTYFTSNVAMLTMALLLLLHAFFGQTWCLYQAIIFIGLILYFVSLIANNAVIAAATICIFYLFCSVGYICSRGQPSAYDIAERVDNVHYRTVIVEQKLQRIDKKLDRILKLKGKEPSTEED